MDSILLNKLTMLQNQYVKIESLLNNPDKIDSEFLNKISKEYIKLSEINHYFNQWKRIKEDISIFQKMIIDSADTINDIDLAKNEIKQYQSELEEIEEKLYIILLPKEINDDRGCFLEIHSATGGVESTLFASDLFRMYNEYIERLQWQLEIVTTSYSEHGGFREVIISIPNKGAYSQLKFESGGHRVQRIPDTESQGRIHTSTCTVAVMPILSEKEYPKICLNDLRIDTFRSSGAGGQHVNTTDSAIRITHIPTKLVVECQDERSQHKNKAKALSVLAARLYAADEKKRQQEQSSLRRNLLGSGDRSDRIRTYNFTQNRVTDHRINLTLYCLDKILSGDLNLLINPLRKEHQLERLSEIFFNYYELESMVKTS
ncbi:peptide chain release factor 1 [Candidatus Schneideria nysicola]|uniref:peptide chain release factor 1 n=1 Tax=Candidatus Schneideria nysicola TaxID=1081631 RepID=UPI001CAA5EAB|nr:peptide chain release factor 1 [Candidatus Schneideria nysicola]UAJ65635.1 peptide chain release factor 1 [Candidatus Schneideria nysicola]